MNIQPRRLAAAKRATNVSLRSDLIEEAKQLGINISEACEQGLEKEVARTRAEQWLKENRAALESSNAYVEKHGLPLARYRQF
ncbi:MAG TPA: type II toxin-antitoxin system CcdA family antitoxin [Allosphingosinicella sp.]|nr:type II toxin-antitoxin system CcdA family antitoxin [Allosphingosinicella sp.]